MTLLFPVNWYYYSDIFISYEQYNVNLERLVYAHMLVWHLEMEKTGEFVFSWRVKTQRMT